MVFLPKLGDLPKKKKVFTDIQRFFSAEIRNSRVFFQPNTGDLQTKQNKTKKRSSPKFKGFFRPKSETQGIVFGRMQVISKKKSSPPKLKLVFPAESRNSRVFFWPNAGDLQQKKGLHEIQRVFLAEIRRSPKNRSSPTLGELLNHKTPLFWSKQRQVLHNFGSQIILGGGCFHYWSKNRLQKH